MTMNFKGGGARVRSLLAGGGRPKDLQESALTKDRLRDNIMREQEQKSDRFRAQIEQAPILQRNVDGNPNDVEDFAWECYPEAVRDAARALFGWSEPDFVGADQMRASHELNHAVLKALSQHPAFADMRPHTRNNEVNAASAAMAIGDALQECAQGALAEHIERAEQLREQEQQLQSAQEMLDKLREQARQEITDLGAVSDATKRALRNAYKAAQRHLIEFIDTLVQHAQASGQMGAQAMLTANTIAQAAANALDGVKALSLIPGTEPGTPHNLTVDQQLALAELWARNSALMAIVKMLGRMLRNFRFKRDARMRNVPEEPVGITTGRDLRRVLPRELARAAHPHPALRAKFAIDLAEGNLLQREMIGREPAGKGPIIAVVDGSGSMSGAKFTWASSVELCMLSEAQRTKRAFAGIEFGSANQIKSWLFPKGEPADPMRVIDMAGHFFGGGTDIASGLEEALRVMRDEDQFAAADVIVISDGICHYGDRDASVLAALRDLGCRIHGISILTPNNPYFDVACDWHVDVSDLAGANDATDMLAANLA